MLFQEDLLVPHQTIQHMMDTSTDDNWSKADLRNVFYSFCLLSVPIVTLALLSNGLAFLIFYKKPAFRKILSNK